MTIWTKGGDQRFDTTSEAFLCVAIVGIGPDSKRVKLNGPWGTEDFCQLLLQIGLVVLIVIANCKYVSWMNGLEGIEDGFLRFLRTARGNFAAGGSTDMLREDLVGICFDVLMLGWRVRTDVGNLMC